MWPFVSNDLQEESTESTARVAGLAAIIVSTAAAIATKVSSFIVHGTVASNVSYLSTYNQQEYYGRIHL